ncbi:hypothetical protein acdb102_48010 [Acidothermaceae bacterium B102]|nr:hypothetical protein acdb102_48010 [Acidothermaceae bacterium B102]
MFWLFWPSALGGRTTYVVVHGVSMEPGFHTGDLAILRDSSDFRVGEVVAYHSVTLKTVVLHRIHAVDADGHFVFKGDNNSWLDPDHPSRDRLLGRLWLRIPDGGRYLTFAHSPWGLGLMGAVVIGMGSTKAHRRRSRRARRAHTRPVIPPARLSLARSGAVVAGAAAVLCGVAAGYLCTVPATRTVTNTVTVTHTPALTYVGPARRGTTYPDGQVHTGQPVYLRLAHRLTLGVLDHVTASTSLGATATTAALRVTLAVPGGWSSVLTAAPSASVDTGPADVSVDLDLVAQRLQALSTETGVGQSGATVTLLAHLVTTTTVGGRPVVSSGDTTYSFTLDATELRPLSAATAPLSSGGPVQLPVSTTSVKVAALSASRLSLAGLHVTLGSPLLRLLRLLLLALAVAFSLVCAGLVPLLRSSGGELAHAVSGFGWRLVEVETLDDDEPVVVVTTAAALQRLADRYERLVLYLPGNNVHVFAVHDDGVSYRLTIVAPGVGRRHLHAAA